jgi:hypothetical protein
MKIWTLILVSTVTHRSVLQSDLHAAGGLYTHMNLNSTDTTDRQTVLHTSILLGRIGLQYPILEMHMRMYWSEVAGSGPGGLSDTSTTTSLLGIALYRTMQPGGQDDTIPWLCQSATLYNGRSGSRTRGLPGVVHFA